MTLRYKVLGRGGLRVSQVCLGTMTFGESWGWGASKQECARILEVFGKAGGNFIDTAHIYTNGASEEIVGELTRSDRGHWVISTKFGLSDRPADPNAGGAHRKTIIRQLEDSLRRLGTDYVDVYWLHTWDAFTPPDEVAHALDDLIRTGKILYAGLSNTPAWVVARTVTYAELQRCARLVGIQVPYSLVRRDAEAELFPMARGLGLTAVTWEPLGAGWLTGRYGTHRPRPQGTRITTATDYEDTLATARNLQIADDLAEIAADLGLPDVRVALAWVLAQQQRYPIVPIVGARTAAQLSESLGAHEIVLDGDSLAMLDGFSRIDLGYPQSFAGRGMPYGNTFDRTDAHHGGHA